jgi:hypothetical protein
MPRSTCPEARIRGVSGTSVKPPNTTTLRIGDYVFHRQAQPLGDFKKAWTAAGIRAGLAVYVVDKSKKSGKRLVAEKRLHDFRRTSARNLVRAGVREGVAMIVTGHKTRAVFDRYNYTMAEDQREALGRLDAYVWALPNESK